MEVSAFAGLAAVCFLGAIAPGPSLAVVLRHCRVSRRAGLMCALGHGFAVFLYALLVVLGMASVLSVYPKLMPALQVLGALWLLKISYGLIWPSPQPGTKEPTQGRNHLSAVTDGFAIAFLNPKIALFMLALFSQWLYEGQPFFERMIMAVIAGGVDALWYVVVALGLSHEISQRLLGSRWVDHLLAIILSLVALVVIVRFLVF